MSDLDQTILWLRGLADRGGKGVVNNIDARCLGRIADEIERLEDEAGALTMRVGSCDAEIARMESELAAVRKQLVKKTDALAKIEKTCADFERIMCLPGPKELKEIWYTAHNALTSALGAEK